MKKTAFLLITIYITACSNNRQFPIKKDLKELTNTNFNYTLSQKLEPGKNTIYSPTLLYAWNYLKEETNAELVNGDKLAETIDVSKRYTNTLNEDEYKRNISINDSLIKVTAKFQKSLPFLHKFSPNDIGLVFSDNEKITSFGSLNSTKEANKQITILHYKNDNDFAVKIQPKDIFNEIILYQPQQKRTSLLHHYKELQKKISKRNHQHWKYQFLDIDVFETPILEFNIEANIEKLIGTKFSSEIDNLIIEQATQQTALIFDEEGAEIKSKATISAIKEATDIDEPIQIKPIPKRLIFNKPYLLIFKKKDQHNPYFLAWISNSELMRKRTD